MKRKTSIAKKIKVFFLTFLLSMTLFMPSPYAFSLGGGGGGNSGGAIQEQADALKDIWVRAFMLMTEQFTIVMMQQVQIIGTFFDAKHQLETQRLFQQKTAEAHKDYHPSEQMCEIGTFVRNLSRTEERIKLTRNAVQNASLARALASGAVKTMDDQGSGSDEQTRLKHYIDTFCDVNDNMAHNELLCVTSKHVAQQNADINYTQTIDYPLTLDIDLEDPAVTREEENVFAFLDQIFVNEPFTDVPREKTVLHNFVKPYQEMRSLVAMRSVAQNSFAHIIGEKSRGLSPLDQGGDEVADIAPFIRALLAEMGLTLDYTNDYIGEDLYEKNAKMERPSYHAQMEILTKKMIQNPEFMANLYDKPANVKRIRAALSAIKLMQDRDIYNAMQRREMLTSMILELQLRHKQNDLHNKIEDVIANIPDITTEVYGDGSQNSTGVGTYNERTGAGGF